MSHSDYNGLINACARYGDPASGGDAQLWAASLEYFAAQANDCSAEICDVLARVEEGGWLPPLQVGEWHRQQRRLCVCCVWCVLQLVCLLHWCASC